MLEDVLTETGVAIDGCFAKQLFENVYIRNIYMGAGLSSLIETESNKIFRELVLEVFYMTYSCPTVI